MLLSFHPIFMERVWGGRRLAELFRRSLPPDIPIGESWELVDRPEAQSVVAGGPLDGATLHDLWSAHREEIFGVDLPDSPRFPILVKLLDARDRLSIQVHPPARAAAALGGEPKTEMWYILHADPGAELVAGLRPGIDRARLAEAIRLGTVADVVGRVPVAAGDSLFLPSGLLHAIGAGLVIAEVQQNSDTTYRVFDWNRPGLDGKPRALHVEQSLASIDFDSPAAPPAPRPGEETIARCPHFETRHWHLQTPRQVHDRERFALLLCIGGEATLDAHTLRAGDFALVPASVARSEIRPARGGVDLLRVTLPDRDPSPPQPPRAGR